MLKIYRISENAIIWDGQGDLFAGKNVVQLQDGEWCSIGGLYEANGTPRFIEQEVPEE